MARTQKDIAAYFPHDAKASVGDTLTVLQSRYKNDGYAFWFKLLEKLASSDGHYLDLRNPQRWQTFIAKMGVDEITTVEILNLLVEMEAIDGELWQSKLVWCQNLVNNLADVYKNRRREIPQKPITTGKNGITTVEIPEDVFDEKITTPESTQSKLKKNKEEETKEEYPPLSPLSSDPQDNENIKNFFPTTDQVIWFYQEQILLGGTVTEEMDRELHAACVRYRPGLVHKAVKEAKRVNKPSWRYIMGILQNWSKEGRR